jgi:C-terminal processing protease CtpA/Prc
MIRLIAVVATMAVWVGPTSSVLADGAGGWFGMTLNVDAGGNLLRPTVNSAKILNVASNSPAAVAGVSASDEVLEIEGLTIAGGKAKELQAVLAKSVGESLRMRLRHSDGETCTVIMTAVQKPDAANK